MTNAKKDNNQVPVLLGASNADGTTPLPIQVDPATHEIIMDDNTTGSNLSDSNARRDNNAIPIGLAVSSIDDVTPVMIYIDSVTNKLLVTTS